MSWTPQILARLVELAGKTAILEEDCETLLAEFAATADSRGPAARAAARQHLDICEGCREELAALRLAIARDAAAPID